MAKRTPRQELRASTTRAPYRREKASAVPVSATADDPAVVARASDAKASNPKDSAPSKDGAKVEPAEAKGTSSSTSSPAPAAAEDPKGGGAGAAGGGAAAAAPDQAEKSSNSEKVEAKSDAPKAGEPAKAEAAKPEPAKAEAAAPEAAKQPEAPTSAEPPKGEPTQAGPSAAELVAIAAAALASTAAVVEPLPAPDALDSRDPDSAAEPPGRAPPGDARSMRDQSDFALVYRHGAAVVSRRGRLGTFGAWRVVDYPGPAQAAHAYALECSRLAAQGFQDVG